MREYSKNNHPRFSKNFNRPRVRPWAISNYITLLNLNNLFFTNIENYDPKLNEFLEKYNITQPSLTGENLEITENNSKEYVQIESEKFNSNSVIEKTISDNKKSTSEINKDELLKEFSKKSCKTSKFVLNPPSEFFPNGFQRTTKYDTTTKNLILKNSIANFFKQQKFKILKDQIKNLALYKEGLMFKNGLNERIFQVYMANVGRSESEEINSQKSLLVENNQIQASKSMKNRFMNPFKKLSKKYRRRQKNGRKISNPSLVVSKSRLSIKSSRSRKKKFWSFRKNKRKKSSPSKISELLPENFVITNSKIDKIVTTSLEQLPVKQNTTSTCLNMTSTTETSTEPTNPRKIEKFYKVDKNFQTSDASSVVFDFVKQKTDKKSKKPASPVLEKILTNTMQNAEKCKVQNAVEKHGNFDSTDSQIETEERTIFYSNGPSFTKKITNDKNATENQPKNVPKKISNLSKIPIRISKPKFCKIDSELIQNNRKTISILSSQVEGLQIEIKDLKDQRTNLKNMLDLAIEDKNKYKKLLNQKSTEFKVEFAYLECKLAKNEEILKDLFEAGEILTADILSVKNKLSEISLDSFPFEKFEEKNIPDLLEVSRNLINNLVSEVSKTKEDLKIKSEEIEDLRENLAVYHERTKEFHGKIEVLEGQIEDYKNEIKIKDLQIAEERNFAIISSQNINELSKTLTDKELNITNLKDEIQTLTTENINLSHQLENIQKLMDKNYISSVLKHSMESQEKNLVCQSQFSEFNSAKSNLMELNSRFLNERDFELKNQRQVYEEMQQKQQEFDKINEENRELREQILKQRNELLGTNNEISKQIDETNLMKLIYSQLNCELLRSRALETNSLSMNFEANRLAVAAEHNSFVSKQLQSILKTKDEMISNFSSEIEKIKNLNESLIEAKESLNAERKQLKTELSIERQKCQELIETKEEIEKLTDFRLQEMQQLLVEERSVLHELKNDHKNLNIQRNALIEQVDQYKKHIEHLKTSEHNLQKLLEKSESKCFKLEEKCRGLEKNLQEVIKSSDLRDAKYRDDITVKESEFWDEIRIKNQEIQKYKNEIAGLEKSVAYLQCNTQKLYEDLNILRQTEQQNKNLEQDLKIQIDTKNKEIQEEKLLLERAFQDNKILNEILEETKESNSKTIDELQNRLTEFSEQKLQLEKELKEHEKVNKENIKNTELLLQELHKSTSALKEYQEKCLELENILQENEKKIEDLKEKTKKHLEKNSTYSKLEEQFLKLKSEHEFCQKQKENFENEIKALKKNLTKIIDGKNKECDIFEKIIKDFHTEKKIFNELVQNDLKNLKEKFVYSEKIIVTKIQKLREAKRLISDLNGKFRATLEKLVDEKIQRQCLEKNCMRQLDQIFKLGADLKQAHECIETLWKRVEKINGQISEFSEIKEKLQSELEFTKESLLEYQNYSENLETQLQSANYELESLKNKSITQDVSVSVQTISQTCLTTILSKQVDQSDEKISLLKYQLVENQNQILFLQNEISKMDTKNQTLEFEKSLLSIEIEELKNKLKNQEKIILETSKTNERILAALAKTNLADNTGFDFLTELSELANLPTCQK